MSRIPPYIVSLCRQLRRDSTNAEELLWSCLRRKQLGGFKFRRQHPIRRYIADFCCIEAGLVVEIDGPVHAGRHQRIYDQRRDQELALLGYRVVRFGVEEVIGRTEQVLWEILNAITATRPPRESGVQQSKSDRGL